MAGDAAQPSGGSPDTAKKAVDPLVGQVLAGRFKVLSLIDRGGMGKVYRAEQMPLGRLVAVKTLDIVDRDGEFRKRFFLEASVCAKLTHPNTVRIFDYGTTDDGVYFIAMEYLEGRPLSRVIKASAPLPPLRAIHITRQICSALHEAHERGMIHRDMKPGNVFLVSHADDVDFAKVLDFGLVKDLEVDAGLSKDDRVLGSPLYMSPEQVEAKPVDQRTDIYSVGLMLYVMLCGRKPFKGPNSLAIMMQQVSLEPPTFKEVNPGLKVPASLEWVVRAAIQKSPNLRIGSMRELSKALRVCARELRDEIPPVQFGFDFGKVVLPEGLEDEEDASHGDLRPAPRSVTDSSDDDEAQITGEATGSTTLMQTMSRPAPIAAGALLVSLLVAGAVVAVVAVAVVAIVWLLPGAPELEPVAEVPAVVEVTPTPPPPPVEIPAEPEVREVAIVSDPEGAEVMREGALLGSTPMTLNLPAGQSWTITLSLDKHEDRTLLVDGSTAEVSVRLPKVRRRRGGPTPTPEATPKPQSFDNEIRDPWEN